jgi:hypothetical protein
MTPAWTIRLLAELDAADHRAIAVASNLTPQHLNWKPSSAEWSVGQCLEHLAIGNELYLRAMSPALDGKPRRVTDEIRPGWFGRWFIRSYIAPSATTRRGRAPRKIRPSADVPSSVLERFLASNNAVRRFIDRARDYDVNRIRFKNPFVAVIRFTLGTGLEITSKHEMRHLLQAERIRAALAASIATALP